MKPNIDAIGARARAAALSGAALQAAKQLPAPTIPPDEGDYFDAENFTDHAGHDDAEHVGHEGTPLRPLLDPADPRQTARLFLSTRYGHADGAGLIHAADSGFRFDGTAYEPLDPMSLCEQIYTFCEHADRPGKKARETEPFKPTKHTVGAVLHALEAMVHTERPEPCWVRTPERLRGAALPDPARVIVSRTGLWTIQDGELVHAGPCTPALYTTNALDFDVDPDATVPEEWLTFLDQITAGDAQTQQLLQEWAAYLLSSDTSLQKIMMMVGPPRSGKGTFARILRRLLGEKNTVAPTLSGLGTNFGLAPLLNKRLAVISDARLSGRSDLAVVIERMLSISGEDPQTIDRKNLPAVTVQLPTRLMILTNELPKLVDGSGALGNRFLIASTPNSFLGREDPGLTDRLYQNLPGILRWAVAGDVTLRHRGRFEQPQAGQQLKEELLDLTSPVGAFVRDCCEVRAGVSVTVAAVYDAWRGWCHREGRDRPGDRARFGRDMRAAVPGLRTSQHRTDDGSRVRTFDNIRLTPEAGILAMTASVTNTTEGAEHDTY